MNDLETLEIRLAAALNRVSTHIENPIKQNNNFELERIDRLERRILILTDQLEAQETENIRLSKTIAELVKSNQIIHHLIENDTVLSYSNIRVGGDKIPANYVDRIGEPLLDGFISLQSEGHPVEFRNIKIKNLDKPF
jgi:hypothetical protein